MSLKRRVQRLEGAVANAVIHVPMLTMFSDGTCYEGAYVSEEGERYGRQTTYEEWQAQYGEQIERAQRLDPKRIFIISINIHPPRLR